MATGDEQLKKLIQFLRPLSFINSFSGNCRLRRSHSAPLSRRKLLRLSSTRLDFADEALGREARKGAVPRPSHLGSQSWVDQVPL